MRGPSLSQNGGWTSVGVTVMNAVYFVAKISGDSFIFLSL